MSKRKLVEIKGAAPTAESLISCDLSTLVGSCGDDVEKLTSLCEVSKAIQSIAEAKIKKINAVTRKCSVPDCQGDGSLDVERCQCQRFRICSKCAETVHYISDEDNEDDDNDEEDEEDRESRDSGDQREKLDEFGAARCFTCDILLCSACMNDEPCKYCGKALCKGDAITSLCKYSTYCEACEDEHECPDCDICDGYAPAH